VAVARQANGKRESVPRAEECMVVVSGILASALARSVNSK